MEIKENGVAINKDSSQLNVDIYKDNIIRVNYSILGDTAKYESLVIINEAQKTDWDHSFKDDLLYLKTDKLKVEINTITLKVSFFDNSGNILLQEKNREFHPETVMDEEVYNVSQVFKLSEDEGIYGLGQHQEGIMNFRDDTVTLIQTNTVAVNPFLISTKNYGILWDNYSKTIFTDNANGAEFWSEVGDHLDYYFVSGNSMDDIISGYRWLTGSAPMFGKWAYGFWQCKERYVNADDLLGIVKEYRKREIPIDNIVQDWCYWADYDPDDGNKTWQSAKANWSSMKFDPSTYSDPQKIIEEIHNKYHMHYMISIWPALGPETEIFQEMSEKGFTYPPQHWSSGYLYDAFNKEARDIYWEYIKKGIMANGVDALWMDGTEPELGDQHTFEVSESNIKKFGKTARGSMARNLNAYSLATTDGVYNNWRRDIPEKRVFILTRSAFTGQQRNAAVTWSGDINARFDVLKDQISSGVNFSMAGIPYWTTDIGGFFLRGHDVGHGPGLYPEGHTDPSYRELYVRWFQYGAFCPIFRSHGTHTPREVWRFGEPGDWAYDAQLRFDNLRYRLLPYIYSLAWKVTNEGYTMMRGLPMDYANDKETFDINDEFLFGSLLVCPVTEHHYFPLEKADLKEIGGIDVYLPAGNIWFDFWTGKSYNGGQTIYRETPIDIIPLYVPAGSIIPMGPFLQYADEKAADPMEIRVYPGKDGEFVLYEDENDNYNYEKGILAEIPFTWNNKKKSLTIGERNGSFPGMLESRTINIVIVSQDKAVGVEVADNPDKTIIYSGNEIKVEL